MEAVGKGVGVGEISVPEISFAGDVVGGMFDTSEGFKIQIDAAEDFAYELKLSANVKKCAVLVCSHGRRAVDSPSSGLM